MEQPIPSQRSALMSRVRQKNTKPELVVRRLLRSMGFGYRLHARDLPGSPDIVFRGRRSVVFVHGCFWHGHHDCRLATIPRTRMDFWLKKIEDNRSRDARKVQLLEEMGWRVLTVWQCQLKDEATLAAKLRQFLNSAISIRGKHNGA